MKKILFTILFLFSFVALSHAAGTVVKTEITYTSIKKISFAYTTDGAGAADSISTSIIVGMLERVVFDWVDAANLYDVVINDADGFDILIGNGANLAQADTQLDNVSDGLGAVVNSTVTLGITNGGAAATGVVHLYFR